MTNGISIRSRCEWLEQGEKSTKLFLNPKKHRATKNQIARFHSKTRKCNYVEITKTMHKFYESFFQQKETKLQYSPQQIFHGQHTKT